MKRVLAATAAAVMMIALVSSAALAAPKPTSLWNVSSINAGGASYTPKAAPGVAGSTLANFDFTDATNTALLTTSKDRSLLGDLTGKVITATFSITGSTDAGFTYSGAPGECGLNGPFVRLYFTGNGEKSPGFYSDFWWSHPGSAALSVTGTSQVTLTASLADVAGWSDWNGQSPATNFLAAAASVSEIGLSFGGGCFFANGVGLSAGDASFHLISYSLADTASFKVDYFTVSGDATFNPAGAFCRSAAPRTSVPLAGGGAASQSVTSSRAVTLTTTGVTSNYADNGFYVAVGTLGVLATSGYAVTASGATPVSTNVWFDTGGDGTFFAWDANGCLTNLNSDTYASMASTTVTGSTPMYALGGIDVGQGTYTLSQLAAGAVSGISSSTPVAVWVGFVGNGSATVSDAP